MTHIFVVRFKLCHTIARMTRYLEALDAMSRLFWALVGPHLELASAVWNNLLESECKRTEAVQMRLVCIVYDRHFPRRLKLRIPLSC